ncbi:MAG: carbon-nitrogen hydrolase family protein [Rickettsiaceae bacterium]|jgi:predicted amidohydrolase|nr:carbon-nitrogen hydrolase family protein [Rickettsiaceae bacterium]
MKLNIACVQISSQNDMAYNTAKLVDFITQAAEKGADFITLPENTAFMAANAEELRANTYFPEEHPFLNTMCDLAARLKNWLLIGSLAVKVNHSDKLANRSLLINDKGHVVTYYDKIHLYQASIQGGETHNEGNRFFPGDKLALADTPWGKVGMSICYDLRFPQMFRKMAKAGAGIITVPSAFTETTGIAHWHVLLRARAIENGCYIVAPAQSGAHPASRKTYGHSLVVDPWGTIVLDGGENEGINVVGIDTDLVSQVRQQLPSLEHDRDFF